MGQQRFSVTKAVKTILRALEDAGVDSIERHVLGDYTGARFDAHGRLLESSLPEDARESACGVATLVTLREVRRRIKGRSINVVEGQRELFRLYAALFDAVTCGASLELAFSDRRRFYRQLTSVVWDKRRQKEVDDTCYELLAFIGAYGECIHQHARDLGGFKLAVYKNDSERLNVRTVLKTALLADTQLIADPSAERLMLASHEFLAPHELDWLKVAVNLAELLQLRPLVDADLQVPPIVVYSGSSLKPEFHRQIYPDKALVGDTVDRIVASTGRQPDHDLWRSVEGAVFDHLLHVNISDEFRAQPLMTTRRSWNTFRDIASASATSLHRQEILSRQSLDALRALQDSRFSWLSNIPVQAFPEILSYQEHRSFRERLQKCTSQLYSASSPDLNRVVSALSTELASMSQEYAKTIKVLNDKYKPKLKAIRWVGAAGFLVTGAGMAVMPYLAPPVAPLVLAALGGASATSVGVLSAAAAAYLKERIALSVEKETASRSMLGVFAAARGAEPRDETMGRG